MDGIIELPADTEQITQKRTGELDQPKTEWIRYHCPACGAPVIANIYYVGGHGYVYILECWAALAEEPTCTYRRVG